MNIFQKNCPECTAPNPAEATSCRCGYCFDPETLADADPSEYAQQQDRLYCDYLAARIAQAEAELTVARELANADPESTYKASNALVAEQSLNTLKAEFKQLSLCVSAIASARRPVPARRPISQPRPAAAVKPPASSAAAEPKPKLTASKAPTATTWKTTSPQKTAAQRLPAPTQQRKLQTPITAPPSRPKALPSRQIASRQLPVAHGSPRQAAPPMTAASKAPQMPSARRQPPALPVNGKNRQTAPNITSRPDQRFRQLQTQKAEAIARSKPSVADTSPARKQAKAAAQSPSADIPPLVLLKNKPTQECPNCTASVAADSPRCTCGFVLSPAGDEVPALTLDATALAILTEGIRRR